MLGDGVVEKEGIGDLVSLAITDSRDDVDELRVLLVDCEAVIVIVISFEENGEKEADFDGKAVLEAWADAVSEVLDDDDFDALADRVPLAVEHVVRVMRNGVPDALLDAETDEDGERLCVSDEAALGSLVCVFETLCETVSPLLDDALLLTALLRDSRIEYDSSKDDGVGVKVPLFVNDGDFVVLDEPVSDTVKMTPRPPPLLAVARTGDGDLSVLRL